MEICFVIFVAAEFFHVDCSHFTRIAISVLDLPGKFAILQTTEFSTPIAMPLPDVVSSSTLAVVFGIGTFNINGIASNLISWLAVMFILTSSFFEDKSLTIGVTENGKTAFSVFRYLINSSSPSGRENDATLQVAMLSIERIDGRPYPQPQLCWLKRIHLRG
jgi:hypothetical protein